MLLVIGYLLIKRRREVAHKRVMLLAFTVSVAFLVCYVAYHLEVGSVKFQGTGAIRVFYFVILISHVVLAAVVPILALATIVLGLRSGVGHVPQLFGRSLTPNRQTVARRQHAWLARWTFPIWLYVSVTGVIVYWMLYHLYPIEA